MSTPVDVQTPSGFPQRGPGLSAIKPVDDRRNVQPFGRPSAVAPRFHARTESIALWYDPDVNHRQSNEFEEFVMDPNRIDHLARVIGSGQSRRRILKTLAGAALGALTVGIGRDDARAAKRRTNGNICASNANCLSNVCVNQGRNRRICGCGSPNDCPPPSDQCHVATCLAGVCGIGADPSSNTDCCSSNSDCDLGLSTSR